MLIAITAIIFLVIGFVIGVNFEAKTFADMIADNEWIRKKINGI